MRYWMTKGIPASVSGWWLHSLVLLLSSLLKAIKVLSSPQPSTFNPSHPPVSPSVPSVRILLPPVRPPLPHLNPTARPLCPLAAVSLCCRGKQSNGQANEFLSLSLPAVMLQHAHTIHTHAHIKVLPLKTYQLIIFIFWPWPLTWQSNRCYCFLN